MILNMAKLIFIILTILIGISEVNGHECIHLIERTSLKFYKADFVFYAKIKKNHAKENEIYNRKWELEIIELFKGEKVDTFKTTTKRLCHTSWFREGDEVIIYGEKRMEKNVAYDTRDLINRIVKHNKKDEHRQAKYYQEQTEIKGKIELEKLIYLKQHFDLSKIKKYIPTIKINSVYPNKTIKKTYKYPKRIQGLPRKIKINYHPKGIIYGNDTNNYLSMEGIKAIHIKLEFEGLNELKKVEFLNTCLRKRKNIIIDFFEKGDWTLINPENIENFTLIETIYILVEDRRVMYDF